VDWLLQNHRELIDAEFALNPDSGGVVTDQGQGRDHGVRSHREAVCDFQVLATNPGGHSSLPKPDNAIYHVADALARWRNRPFPFELNNVTREYFQSNGRHRNGPGGGRLPRHFGHTARPAAITRLSQNARFNSTMRTTCVATMLSGGHAPNALPQRAEANVNCRILPGHSQEEVRLELVKMFGDNDAQRTLSQRCGRLVGSWVGPGKAMAPPPLRSDVMDSLHGVVAKLWPGVPVIPIMETGASDSIYTMMAGIPSYGICGVAIDRNDVRMHGKDERVPVDSYYKGVEFYYEFLEKLTTHKH
jgi:acetylornithine deacetylase/succinyl-diaminopimelate desuccinylase-like protein